MNKNPKFNSFSFKNTKGVEYQIIFRKPNKRAYGEECDGYCEDPKDKSPKIVISPYLTKQSELNTIVHEMAHAFFWDKPEADIFAFANSVSRMLYNHCNWRKVRYEKNKKCN
jgi:hypothetical protein|tara:strand:- start:2381 stop:2716 length:336 start_codon:yes stop_codon:yes gene_type:complete